jgi:predicted small lipoprotein YifL
MLAVARVIVVLATLTGCGLPTPPNATPCERAPGTRECQIWMDNRMGA